MSIGLLRATRNFWTYFNYNAGTGAYMLALSSSPTYMRSARTCAVRVNLNSLDCVFLLLFAVENLRYSCNFEFIREIRNFWTRLQGMNLILWTMCWNSFSYDCVFSFQSLVSPLFWMNIYIVILIYIQLGNQ